MPTNLGDRVLSWASDIDGQTIAQAQRAAKMPFIAGHIALMPDAHLGKGATVGSVIPTEGAIMPSAVGVDIGCGMIAVETNLNASQLPDDLNPFLSSLEQVIPAGVGKGHDEVSKNAGQWFFDNSARFSKAFETDEKRLSNKILTQFGTLGSGNHFFEVCLDERECVWIVLHSGSRGIGNILATLHINVAKKLMKQMFIKLDDPDLAYFVQGTDEFQNYIYDMQVCQDYAMANREQMMDSALKTFFLFVNGDSCAVDRGQEVDRINCHHNFTQMEHHGGKNVWLTRKGAIKADKGDRGIIPGSMGTRSYIVRGLGSKASYNSCSHGAGRRFSRSKAKELFTPDNLREQMAGKVWLESRAQSLVDEIPSCYKDVEQVMEDQKDLVKIDHTLHQILNYKGI